MKRQTRKLTLCNTEFYWIMIQQFFKQLFIFKHYCHTQIRSKYRNISLSHRIGRMMYSFTTPRSKENNLI
jgi:hypothetical protein